MATAQDYAGTAAAIYGPQQAAEQAGLDTSHTSNLQSLQSGQATLKPQLDSSESKVKDIYNSNIDKAAFTYSRALGGNVSGLLQNENTILTKNYADSVSRLEADYNNKLNDITGKINVENSNYGVNSNALKSKYSGLMTQYQVTAADQANQLAEQQRQFEQTMALNRAKLAQVNAPQAAYTNGAAARAAYNGDLDTLEGTLKGFQAAGYKGNLPTKATIKSQLTSQYSGFVSAKEINGYVDTLYSRYKLS